MQSIPSVIRRYALTLEKGFRLKTLHKAQRGIQWFATRATEAFPDSIPLAWCDGITDFLCNVFVAVKVNTNWLPKSHLTLTVLEMLQEEYNPNTSGKSPEVYVLHVLFWTEGAQSSTVFGRQYSKSFVGQQQKCIQWRHASFLLTQDGPAVELDLRYIKGHNENEK